MGRHGGSGAGVLLLVGYGRGTPPLAEALDRQGHLVLEAPDLSAVTPRLLGFRPDTILVGASPRTSETLAFLERMRGQPPVLLFLAPSSDPELAADALEHGADDVVCPPHSASAVLLRRHLALERRHQGTRTASDRRLRAGRLSLDLTTRRVSSAGRSLTLSGREFELLVRLMEAPGEVVERDDLLTDIWGNESGSDAVLDATVYRLRRRLKASLDASRLVTTIRGVGYRLEPPPAGEARPGNSAAD